MSGHRVNDVPTHYNVEVRGFEPLTFSMPWRRATNCAIPPQSRSHNNSLIVPALSALPAGPHWTAPRRTDETIPRPIGEPKPNPNRARNELAPHLLLTQTQPENTPV